MTKTFAILLGLAVAWLTAWTIAGCAMRSGGAEKLAQGDHVAALGSRLERGVSIGVQGSVAEGPKVVAPYSEKPCLVAVTRVFIRTSSRDSKGKDVWTYHPVATRRAGPAAIEIAVGDQRLALPVELWVPTTQSTSEAVREIPARLAISPEEIARAEKSASGVYWVDEAMLQGGERFFVVGKLESGDGPLRLAADPVLGRVELYPGSQADFVESLRSGGSGLRIAGWILGLGLGPAPLAVVLLVLVKRRRRAQPSPAPEL